MARPDASAAEQQEQMGSGGREPKDAAGRCLGRGLEGGHVHSGAASACPSAGCQRGRGAKLLHLRQCLQNFV